MSAFYVRISKREVAAVESLVAAGAAVRAEIERTSPWMGSGTWYRTVAGHERGVIVYNAQQKPVACVSYNGRLWGLDGREIVP